MKKQEYIDVEATNEAYDYTNAFKAKFQWLIAGGLAAIGSAFIGSIIGLPAVTVIWTYAFFIFVAYVAFAANWPNAKDKGFWIGFNLAVFPTVLIGYRQEGLKTLPWKLMLTMGSVAALIAPASIVGMMGANLETILVTIGLVMIYIPVSYLVGYWIGYAYKVVEVRANNVQFKRAASASTQATKEADKASVKAAATVEEAKDAIKEAASKTTEACTSEETKNTVKSKVQEAKDAATGIFANLGGSTSGAK